MSDMKTFAMDEVFPTETDSLSNEDRLARLERKVDAILAVMERTETMISKVADEVMPTIESLANNPMIKALGIGGKFGKKS